MNGGMGAGAEERDEERNDGEFASGIEKERRCGIGQDGMEDESGIEGSAEADSSVILR
jgi:hypothetical protein